MRKTIKRDISKSLLSTFNHLEGKPNNGRVTKYSGPPDVNVIAIREHLGLSQEQFAKSFGFSVWSVRNWEQGRRQPEGPARTLLKIIEKDPDIVVSVLHDH